MFELDAWRDAHGRGAGVVNPSNEVVEEAMENVGADLELEQTRVVHTPEVTHIRYRVEAGSRPAGSNQGA